MATWQEFARADPELASFGASRMAATGVSFLATVRADGSPRVHPVTPLVTEGRLLVFMEPTSPKGHDLRRDPRYALHCAVDDSSGAGGEFGVAGTAKAVVDPAVRAAAASPSTPERYVLFELGVNEAFRTVYEDGRPVRSRWNA